MAQDVSKDSRALKQRLEGKNLAVAVAAGGVTELLNIVMGGIGRVFCTIENDGANALDAFIISGKAHEEGEWVELYAAAAAFAAPAGILIGVSTTNPFTLAAAGRSWFVLDTMGLYALKIEASAAAGGAVVDIFISGNGY